jgi:hypothetical protein
MNKNMLLGFLRHLLPIPRRLWQGEVEKTAHHGQERLAFMSAEHHRVRDFVVVELPRRGKPLPPQEIAKELALPIERVTTILDELEKHLTFLYRNPQGEVTWAYPVTVERTPHRVTFSTGEQIYAA